MASEEPIIRVDHVSRDFQVGSETIHALRDVDFGVKRGEFVAVIGRSGSGKTTLLNMIAGLDRPSVGRVVVDGREVSAMNESQLTQLRRRTIGFVFQSFGLLPLLSAYENIEVALRIAGAGASERTRRTGEVLDLVGLRRRANHRPYELSGGEQQRVAIARALANKPAIILADEPTGELDSTTAAQIFQLLVDVVRSENVTILTTTHDRMVMERAQRVLELSDGVLLAEPRLLERPETRQPVTAPWSPRSITPAGPRETMPVDEDEDWDRWRPQQRPQRGIYQPPGSPREPL